MGAKLRREKILSHLKNAGSAVNGTQLAGIFEVSRQVIVGDIAARAPEMKYFLTLRAIYTALKRAV